jgi:hypothetical protein
MNEQTDHDLLIRLDQKMSDVQKAISELHDGTHSKITALEKDKADREDVEALQVLINENIEIRVRKLETSTSSYKITLALYSLLVAGMLGLLMYHITQVK